MNHPFIVSNELINWGDVKHRAREMNYYRNKDDPRYEQNWHCKLVEMSPVRIVIMRDAINWKAEGIGRANH